MNDPNDNANLTPERIPMMEENLTELKLAINNLIWMHSPHDITLTEAEDIALKVMDLIMNGNQPKGE